MTNKDKFAQAMFLISCVVVAIVYGFSSDDIWDKDKDKKLKGVKLLTEAGLIQFALINAIKHIFFTGSIFKHADKTGAFFEIEAGGGQLGVAIMAFIYVLMDTSLESYASLYIIYGIYLFVSMCATIWIGRGIFLIIAFISIVTILLSTGIQCLV